MSSMRDLSVAGRGASAADLNKEEKQQSKDSPEKAGKAKEKQFLQPDSYLSTTTQKMLQKP